MIQNNIVLEGSSFFFNSRHIPKRCRFGRSFKKIKKRPKRRCFMSQRDQTTSFWPEFQQTRTLVPANVTTPRKKNQTKKKRKRKKKRKKRKKKRKKTYTWSMACLWRALCLMKGACLCRLHCAFVKGRRPYSGEVP